MASIYIASTDVTDQLAAALLVVNPTALDRVDAEINDLSQKVGLYSYTNIIVPLHYGIKRWAATWLSMTLFLEAMGVNNVEMGANDKYAYKYEYYRKLEGELRKNVTKEMFINAVIVNTDRAPTQSRIVRG